MTLLLSALLIFSLGQSVGGVGAKPAPYPFKVITCADLHYACPNDDRKTYEQWERTHPNEKPL
jgi:hypothetical protein